MPVSQDTWRKHKKKTKKEDLICLTSSHNQLYFKILPSSQRCGAHEHIYTDISSAAQNVEAQEPFDPILHFYAQGQSLLFEI